MRIAILLPMGIILGLIFLLVALPSYLPNELVMLFEIIILLTVLSYAFAGIIR